MALAVMMYRSFLISVLLPFGFTIAMPQLDSSAVMSSLSIEEASSFGSTGFGSTEALVQITTTTKSHPEVDTMVQITVASSTPISSTSTSSPPTTEASFPLSLTGTLRSLSENDSKATVSTTSSLTQAPSLITQASPVETGFSTPGQFKAQILLAHNWYRAAHGADPLDWNDALANTSSNWVAECVWNIVSTPDIGRTYAASIPTSASSIMNYWGLERRFYNWSDPGLNNSTRQFTQMVWKSTTQFGCAWNNCPPGSSPDTNPPASTEVSLFLLCQYYPKGNIGTSMDWEHNVGELESGSLGQGVVAASGYGLSSLASTTRAISATATGVDIQSVGNKLDCSLFAMILSSAVIVGSVAIYPSVLISLSMAFGFAVATLQQEHVPSSSLSSGSWLSAFPVTTTAGYTKIAPRQVSSQMATSALNTGQASTSIATTATAAVSSIKATTIANSLNQPLFTMIIGLTILGSASTYPSLLISLLVGSGFVNAIPQSSMQSSLSPITESATAPPLEILARKPSTTYVTVEVPYTTSVSIVPTLNTQAQPMETGFSSPAEFNARTLWGVNWYRKIFGHPDLVWNDTLVGWNFGWFFGYTVAEVILDSQEAVFDILDVVNIWGSEYSLYYQVGASGSFDGKRADYNGTDAFTQMVWKNTKYMGCAWNNCPPNDDDAFIQFVVICSYYPPGNIGNDTAWKDNVGPMSPQAEDLFKEGIGNGSISESKSVASTTTTTLSNLPLTTAAVTVTTSTNMAEKIEQTLLIVIISLVFIVGGTI